MFAIERVKIIKNYLTQNKKVEVSKLSDMLNVSEVTIRKDLEKLESEGFLKRFHGGAVLTPPLSTLASTSTIENFHEEERIREIAAVAIEMIADNDFILLTNGPISLEIAQNLKSKSNLTVLTNDLLISLALSQYPYIKTILLGGDIDSHSKCSYGRLTLSQLSQFYVNKFFIEIEGFSETVGFSVSNVDKATLIQEALSNVTSKIVLFTDEAFNKNAFFKVGALTIADTIITNSTVDPSFKKLAYHHNIQLFTSINLMEGSD
ncbi:DeoR family transcriptional regulator [Sporanaerobium hydrogeniformans]|uniref:DeoR family transcriptional regulator n=1 Tax=Sporanaerobium hydrogeniformans TaxID=3072179 RepID=A0AC61DG33_9FIRM|nr:DeoR/GlpR family DNA-binding transcription regulator [Sporanaerobium hydrogeniformans]PHV72003.1 DeoR family transcriptional regulator [Sporanaerobium hydrogeniformans]